MQSYRPVPIPHPQPLGFVNGLGVAPGHLHDELGTGCVGTGATQAVCPPGWKGSLPARTNAKSTWRRCRRGRTTTPGGLAVRLPRRGCEALRNSLLPHHDSRSACRSDEPVTSGRPSLCEEMAVTDRGLVWRAVGGLSGLAAGMISRMTGPAPFGVGSKVPSPRGPPSHRGPVTYASDLGDLFRHCHSRSPRSSVSEGAAEAWKATTGQLSTRGRGSRRLEPRPVGTGGPPRRVRPPTDRPG